MLAKNNILLGGGGVDSDIYSISVPVYTSLSEQLAPLTLNKTWTFQDIVDNLGEGNGYFRWPLLDGSSSYKCRIQKNGKFFVIDIPSDDQYDCNLSRFYVDQKPDDEGNYDLSIASFINLTPDFNPYLYFTSPKISQLNYMSTPD